MLRGTTVRSRPRPHGVLLLIALLGCAHASPGGAAPASVATCAPEPALTDAAQPPRPHDLTFVMRTRDDGAFAALPDELQTFTLGPWECALGPLGSHDTAGDSEPRIVRARRLACTHKTGATVQSELRCELPATLASDRAASYRRELALTLSGAPDLVIACAPEVVERLGSGRAGPSTGACPIAGAPCPSAANERASVARE